jgi:hypothetical protein
MWARPGLPALLVDLFQDSRTPQIVDSRSPQLLQELAPLGLLQEDLGTVLANILQCRLDVFQVTDVEDGER